MLVRSAVIAAIIVGAGACGTSGTPDRAPSPAPEQLRRVSLPDLSRMAVAVRRQVRARYDAVQQTLERDDSTPAEQAAMFGALGMVLDAAESDDAAEPAYLNAQALAPMDPRWAYYLGHLYRRKGENSRSLEAFRRTLELEPDALAALVWTGRLLLDQGDAERAEGLFERARTASPRTVAVLAGLGQIALARTDYRGAIELFEQALAIDPSAASIHAPLAHAYRGLGQPARAEAHARQWKNTDILVPDPWRQELDLTLDSGLSYELRGIRALEQQEIAAAVRFFGEGAQLEPASTAVGRSLRHKLGTALYLNGDLDGAIAQFEEVLRTSPASPPDETAARAHYSLGVIMASAGRDAAAIRHLQDAVTFSPHYVEALQALGDALQRAGRARRALASYAQILAVAPANADARLSYAMALVAVGRYSDAAATLAEGARLYPHRVEFELRLARLLATAPDPHVRDGARAMTIVDRLLTGEKTIELGETTAMALAEVGDFHEAAAVQRQILDAGARAGLSFDREWMRRNLGLYERRQPVRVPWPEHDPVYRPDPPAGLAALSIAGNRRDAERLARSTR